MKRNEMTLFKCQNTWAHMLIGDNIKRVNNLRVQIIYVYTKM